MDVLRLERGRKGLRMRFTKTTKILATLLLGFSMWSTSSMAALVNPDLRLPGIAPMGNPSFSFVRVKNADYSNNIRSWYSNLVYAGRSRNGVTYDMVVSQTGRFNYHPTADSMQKGVLGNFYLQARFGPAGRLLSGKVIMTGRIEEAGILRRDAVIFSADLTAFSSRGSLIGYGFDNIRCNAKIDNCQNDPNVQESSYFRLTKAMPNIRNLRDNVFSSGIIANTTTVPVPAAVWLMLSGLGALAVRARRKNGTKESGDAA